MLLRLGLLVVLPFPVLLPVLPFILVLLYLLVQPGWAPPLRPAVAPAAPVPRPPPANLGMLVQQALQYAAQRAGVPCWILRGGQHGGPDPPPALAAWSLPPVQIVGALDNYLQARAILRRFVRLQVYMRQISQPSDSWLCHIVIARSKVKCSGSRFLIGSTILSDQTR